MKKAIEKTSKTYDKILREELDKSLESFTDEIIDVIMIEYDSQLMVNDRNSKTNPLLPKYRDEFVDRLTNFSYIKEATDGFVFSAPDMDNFDFSGNRMGIIQNILEGTSGIYVEVTGEEYEQMFGKKRITREELDTDLPPKERVYLMRYTSNVRNAEKNTFGKAGYLTRYPFSNTPPMRVLEVADEYVNNNLRDLIDRSVGKATRRFKRES